MEFRIADTFTDSLARLTGDEQKAVKTTAFDLQLNPAHRRRGDTERAQQLWSQPHQRFEKTGLSARAEGILKRLRALRY